MITLWFEQFFGLFLGDTLLFIILLSILISTITWVVNKWG